MRMQWALRRSSAWVGALAVQVGFHRTASVADVTTITNLEVRPMRAESVHVQEAVPLEEKQHHR